MTIKETQTDKEQSGVDRRQFVKNTLAMSLAAGMSGTLLTACGDSGASSGAVSPLQDKSTSSNNWRPSRTVMVILENSSLQQLINSDDMSYLKGLANRSALMVNAYAASTPYKIIPDGGPFGADPATTFLHPLPARGSQTNYFYQFAGHNQGFLPDWFLSSGSGRLGTAYADEYGNTLPAPIPDTEIGLSNELVTQYLNGAKRVFTTPNLGAAMLQAGYSYATFSESLPHPFYDGKDYNPPGISDGYARRHNPGINWINFPNLNVSIAPTLQRFLLPVSSNLATEATVDPDGKQYPGFGVDKDGKPAGFEQLPTLSIVVPNNMHNRHTGSTSACDDWLKSVIQPFVDWANANDGLLIITTDEDGFTDDSNGMATVAMDAMIKQYVPGATGSYMYGMDRITTLFYGPANRVKTGKYQDQVDALNVLATVLDMYGTLDNFRKDFAAHYGSSNDKIRLQEMQNQLASLTPIKSFRA
ncbi:alkaline phosphatase family protein [Neisseriaceae bacterium TC5R-5]|nr:alkaline phosphatase family protein [Neisseriaceae bacterium TC5R-5]